MYHLYMYFKKFKRQFEQESKFLIDCLYFFENSDQKYNGFLDVQETLKCIRLIEINFNFIKYNYNIYKYRFNQDSKIQLNHIRDKINNNKTNLNTGKLWDNYEIALENWQKERCQFDFKDIISIIVSNPSISDFYTNIIDKFLKNKTTICCCGNMMKIHNSKDCYDTKPVCDFTGKEILNEEILHCGKKSEYHPYGFDIDINNNDEYIEDKIKRNLINRIYFKLRAINSNNLDIIENESVNDYYINNSEYTQLKSKYHYFCKNTMKKTSEFYINSKNDLYSLLDQFRNGNSSPNINISSIIKTKCKIYNYARLLRTNKNWYHNATDVVDEVSIILDDYNKFINKMEPYPFMFENNEIKNKSIVKLRDINKNHINKMKTKMIELEKINHISYDILGKDFSKEYFDLLEDIDTLMYKSYESIETLVKSTVNDEMLEYNIIPYEGLDNSEENLCTICQDSLSNEIFIVKIGKCEHLFHKNCIDNWLIRSNTCPLCR